jgi:hypothetical protein
MIIMDSNFAATFDDSFITDSNYLKWKLVIFVEQFSWKTEVEFLVFKFLQLRQSVETTSKILLEYKNFQICQFSLIVLTKVNHFWQKLFRNAQPKKSYQLWNFTCNFFARILAFFRNNYFIDADSVFRWCFTTEICFWETREWFKIFKYTLNWNGAELFGILHLGTILHLHKCTFFSINFKRCTKGLKIMRKKLKFWYFFSFFRYLGLKLLGTLIFFEKSQNKSCSKWMFTAFQEQNQAGDVFAFFTFNPP